MSGCVGGTREGFRNTMKSSDTGMSEWVKWSGRTVGRAPRTPGVYVLRLANMAVPRLKGESDIVYVGSTSRGRGTIRQRLRRHGCATQPGRSMLNRVRSEVGEIDLAWKSLATHTQALFMESQLLEKYLADHLELPPLNHQESSLKTYKQAKRLLEHVQCVPTEKKRELLAQWGRLLGWCEEN